MRSAVKIEDYITRSKTGSAKKLWRLHEHRDSAWEHCKRKVHDILTYHAEQGSKLMAKRGTANRFILSVQAQILLVSVCFASPYLPLSENQPRVQRSSTGW